MSSHDVMHDERTQLTSKNKFELLLFRLGTARPGLAPAEAVTRYVAFLQEAITQLALSQISGSGQSEIVRPEGFLPAAETRRN